MDTFIQSITRKAGDAVLKRFGKDRLHYYKSGRRGDAVTKADLMSEKLIISAIKKKYPEHGIVAEESGSSNEGAEYLWFIDPIDGTLNFSLGVPIFGVMVCLAHRGEVIFSAIYLPTMREFYFAKKGKGAYLNGARIRCATRKNLDGSVGVSSMSLRQRTARFLQKVINSSGRSHDVMLSPLGSMAVNSCFVACGKRDWMVALVGGIHDFAPAYLMLKEAGCKVTDTRGKPWKLGMLEIVAANPLLHKELLKLTKNV